MNYSTAVALISVVVALIGYIFYFRDIIRGQTKPHAFSWLVWSIVTGIAFAAQISDGAGIGAWVTFASGAVTFAIALIAFRVGKKNIRRIDWIFLLAALVSLIPWLATDNPLYSVLLIICVDFLGFVPTIRKSYQLPFEETLIQYVLSGTKYLLGIAVLEKYSLITVLYPLYLVFANYFFVIMLIARRKTAHAHSRD